MANPFVKAYKYFMSWFGAQVDERADPKIQIQQAIEEAQRQHEALSRQAAAVIGNQRQLEMKLSRQMSDVERLQASARQALDPRRPGPGQGRRGEGAGVRADRADLRHPAGLRRELDGGPEGAARPGPAGRRAGEEGRRAERDAAAAEARRADPAAQPAGAGEDAGDRVGLAAADVELSAPGSTPSLGEVREKIERRYANALGQAELAPNSVEGRMLEVQKSTLDMAGNARLEQIRASMHGGQLASAPPTPAVEAGQPGGREWPAGAVRAGGRPGRPGSPRPAARRPGLSHRGRGPLTTLRDVGVRGCGPVSCPAVGARSAATRRPGRRWPNWPAASWPSWSWPAGRRSSSGWPSSGSPTRPASTPSGSGGPSGRCGPGDRCLRLRRADGGRGRGQRARDRRGRARRGRGARRRGGRAGRAPV